MVQMKDDFAFGQLEDLYERAPCGFIFTLPDGRFVHVNETFARWLGYSVEDLTGRERRFQEHLTLPGRLFYENQVAPLLAMQGEVREVALDLTRADGSVLPCLVNAVRIPEEGDRPALIASVVFDATERRRYERELLAMRRRAEELAAVVNAVQDAILSVSPSGAVQTYNDGARRLFRAYEDELNDRSLRDILRFAEGESAGTFWSRLESGEAVVCDAIALTGPGDEPDEIEVSVSLSPYRSELGELVSVGCVLTDIRERKRLEQMQRRREAQILEAAMTDQLTGVGTRHRLEEVLAIEVERVGRTGAPLAGFMADLDHFKRVNDEFGHPAGDKVLAAFGQLLREHTRATDVLTRFGGEEFLVLLPNTDLARAASIAERIRTALALLQIDPVPHPVTGSFGVAVFAEGERGEDLIRRMDEALYVAKRSGRNRVVTS